MKVDRSKFLLVVGALSTATGFVVASASCTTTSSSSKNDAGTSSDLDSGNVDFDSGSTGDGGGDAGNACLGDLPDASTPGDAGDAGDAATGCAALTGSGCASACDSIAQSFKSGLAEDIRTCLMPAPTCEGTSAVSACVESAVAKACPDPTATSTCTPLVVSCHADDAGADAGDAGVVFDQATCEKVVRSLNQAGRESFTSCITEGISGNCTADPAFCLQQAQFQ